MINKCLFINIDKDYITLSPYGPDIFVALSAFV